MVWQYLVVIAVTLILGIALAPKAPQPRPSAIEDFDLPTAEEGRPIPVVFGEVDIRGQNVLWYGDLSVKPIRKRSGFSKSTVGFKYHLGTHEGLCHGPVDAVTAILAGDKVAFTGSVTGNSTIAIDLPLLFGGDKREGGIAGSVDFCFGGPAQTANAYLSGVQTPLAIPAYRGILGVVCRGTVSGGMYVGTTAYPKPRTYRVRRILEGWQGTPFYSAKATINTSQMNPAHIVYQCLSDTRWGMGIDTTLLDSVTFMATADALFTEGFGLNLIWNQSTSIEEFIQIAMDHIAGALSLNESTGKLELTLIRGDYNPASLDEYDESNVIALQKYQRIGWGETVNDVTIVYTDPDSRRDTSVSQQDLGNIDAQSQVVPQTVQRKGIRSHSVARTVLARELQSRATPLSKITIEVNRKAWNVRYGGLFKFSWAERNLVEVVYRVLKISKGTLARGNIKIEALEDIYALGVNSTLANPSFGAYGAPPSTPADQPDTGINVLSSALTAPPGSPTDGDTYFIPATPSATGAWAGHNGDLADWDAATSSWIFTDVPSNTLLNDPAFPATGGFVNVVSGAVVPPPWPTDHGALTGLADDDHPQYPLAAGTETISGSWTFTANPLLESANPRLLIQETGLSTDTGMWDLNFDAGALDIRTRTDADGTGFNIFRVLRPSGSTTPQRVFIGNEVLSDPPGLSTVAANNANYGYIITNGNNSTNGVRLSLATISTNAAGFHTIYYGTSFSSPTQVANAIQIGNFTFGAYNTDAAAIFRPGAVRGITTETWTASASGTAVQIRTVANGTTTQVTTLDCRGSQTLTLDGSEANPSSSYQSDTDTGEYRIGSNNVGYACGGGKVLDIGTTGLGLTGNLTLGTAGNGIKIKEGTNACMGVATLVAGVAVVATTKVTANSRIFLTCQALGTIAVPVPRDVTARTAGTNFTITSSNITDTSVIAWEIKEPA